MNLKTNRKTKLLTLFLSIVLMSCEKDFEVAKTTNQNTKPNVKSYFINGNQARAVASKLSQQYGKSLSNQNTTFRTDSGMVIDYESIMVVENNLDDIAYTLKVDSNVESEMVFQNLAYIEKDGITTTKLITYEMTTEFATDYNTQLKTIAQFEGTITIEPLDENDCCSENISVITIGNSGGGGDVGTSSNSGSTGGYSSGGASGGWGIAFINPDASGGHINNDGNNGGTSSYEPCNCYNGFSRLTNNTSTFDQNNPPELCCIYDIGLYEDALLKDDCNKLKKIFEDNSTLQNELSILSTKISETVENGLYKLSNSSSIIQAQAGTNGSVEFPNNPSNIYEVVAHTHNSPSTATYSIYSYDDLLQINAMIRNNAIMPSKFTAFLSTADGTHYALTINNLTKFKKAFSTMADEYYDPIASLKNSQSFYKYYEGDGIQEELIQEENTDLNKDAFYFVEMLEYMDCGLSIFETDSNFSNFEKLKLNHSATDLDKKPCNN